MPGIYEYHKAICQYKSIEFFQGQEVPRIIPVELLRVKVHLARLNEQGQSAGFISWNGYAVYRQLKWDRNAALTRSIPAYYVNPLFVAHNVHSGNGFQYSFRLEPPGSTNETTILSSVYYSSDGL